MDFFLREKEVISVWQRHSEGVGVDDGLGDVRRRPHRLDVLAELLDRRKDLILAELAVFVRVDLLEDLLRHGQLARQRRL